MSWTVRGSNPGGGEISRTRPNRSWGPPTLLYNRLRVSFLKLKRSGCGFNHSPPSSAEDKEWVELYFYSPSGPSRRVIGQAFTGRLFGSTDRSVTSYYPHFKFRELCWRIFETSAENTHSVWIPEQVKSYRYRRQWILRRHRSARISRQLSLWQLKSQKI